MIIVFNPVKHGKIFADMAWALYYALLDLKLNVVIRDQLTVMQFNARTMEDLELFQSDVFILYGGHCLDKDSPTREEGGFNFRLNYFVCNYEQATSAFVKWPFYKQIIQNSLGVLEYSDYNIEQCASWLYNDVRRKRQTQQLFLIPFGYHPCLRFENQIVFYNQDLLNENKDVGTRTSSLYPLRNLFTSNTEDDFQLDCLCLRADKKARNDVIHISRNPPHLCDSNQLFPKNSDSKTTLEHHTTFHASATSQKTVNLDPRVSMVQPHQNLFAALKNKKMHSQYLQTHNTSLIENRDLMMNNACLSSTSTFSSTSASVSTSVTPSASTSVSFGPTLVDVLFYGSLNERRRQLLIELQTAGIRIKHVASSFGADLHREIQNAKIVLNLHYYKPGVLEQPRLVPLISNGVFVISEPCVDQMITRRFRDVVVFAELGELVETCQWWLQNNAARSQFAKAAQQRFQLTSRYSDFIQQSGFITALESFC